MRRILLLIPCLLLLLTSNPVTAQKNGEELAPGAHIRFEHLTIDDGLSQNAGLAFLQDRQGFLWIGTQDGLDRYDGHQIVEFRNDPENENSLINNSIISLFQDREGYIWIGTWGGGVSRYDPITKLFVNYISDPNKPDSLINPTVTDIYQDDNGTIWVGTLGGLDRLDPITGGFIPVSYTHLTLPTN
jgi:ligand-binding sensor domain-containing protein